MSTSQQKIFKAGEFLFDEGSPANSIFIIAKGTVAIRKKKNQSFIELDRLGPNSILGELAFFDRHVPRSAAAVAITDVQAMEISFEALDKIYGTIPDYFRAMVASMAERLRKANEKIQRLQKLTIDGNLSKEKDTDLESLLKASAEIEAELDKDKKK